MTTLCVKKAVSPFLFVSVLAILAAQGAFSKTAQAFGIGTGAFYGGNTCGYLCMGVTGNMFAPWQGTSMFPSATTYGYGNGYSYSNGYPYSGNTYAGNYYQTGQIPDQRLAMQQALAWNGAQPMGFSYLPPMGLQASQNWVAASALGI